MQKKLGLIISGSVAAYKSLELIRQLRAKGVAVVPILTKGGAEFVTPLSCASLAEHECYTDLFSLKDEAEMGHIRLSREVDLLLVAPASADLLAKMANGQCTDLASTVLLATDKPVWAVPAMNVRMWEHKSTQRNIAQLKEDGVHFIGPVEGPMACGEYGYGRMEQVEAITEEVLDFFGAAQDGPLKGRHAVVTSGPTVEPIDPVRYIANRSSGKQGHAIASQLAALGANVTLISGPTQLEDPLDVTTVKVESASEMLDATEAALPADIAICAAAVCDWSVENASGNKIKKVQQKGGVPELKLKENPDILKTLSSHAQKPALVVGFAAETEKLVEYAAEKRVHKGCDWIVANNVAGGDVFGQNETTQHVIDASGEIDQWSDVSKDEAAFRLCEHIVNYFEESQSNVTRIHAK